MRPSADGEGLVALVLSMPTCSSIRSAVQACDIIALACGCCAMPGMAWIYAYVCCALGVDALNIHCAFIERARASRFTVVSFS